MHILRLARRCGACGGTLSGRDAYDKLTTPGYWSLEAFASSAEYPQRPACFSHTDTRGAYQQAGRPEFSPVWPPQAFILVNVSMHVACNQDACTSSPGLRLLEEVRATV